MRKLKSTYKFIVVTIFIVMGSKAFCQQDVPDAKSKEIIDQLETACRFVAGCKADSFPTVPCKKGKCTTSDNWKAVGANGSHNCTYFITVYRDELDKRGNPVCCETTHVIGPLPCPKK